jgi:hypothetical protein
MRNKETDMTLEKRIETSIAENTDPFTTDADIRFFETEEWNAEVTLGTKIIGVYGVMHPLFFGEVIGVNPSDPEVKVECESGDVITIMRDEINAAVGKLSPVGYYTEDGYYG